MTQRVIGLDLAMGATGIALANGATNTWTPTVAGDARLVELDERVRILLTVEQPTHAVIEDLPRHAHGAAVTGMVHGIVRCALSRRRIHTILVPPATLKVYACGTGRAKKHDMQMELFQRAGLDIRDDNACDAWWLRAIGLDLCGEPVLALPKDHRRALDKLPSYAHA